MNIFEYLFENSFSLNKDFVLGPKETASFKKIFNDSLSIANFLKAETGEGNNILLISPNSAFFITAYLGIMKSGNVCVPLNPGTEQKNLDFIVKETKSEFVFAPRQVAQKLNLPGIKIFTEVDLNDMPVQVSKSLSSATFDEKRVAQILFTSGSTGLPKGVMLSHKNLISNTNSIIKYLHLTRDDIMEVVLPFSYCYGLSLLHTHLKVGGSVVLNNTFIFLGSVISDLEKYKCSGFAGVPSHFQILLRKSTSFMKKEFPALKYVTQAGGKLHYTFIEEFVDAFPDTKFCVMYGQTEATARLSYLPPEMVKIKKGSIGKGIPDVILEVVNKNGEPVKPGETGEIIAKGDNVMMGYLNEPEETKKTIRDGWLSTGDLATKDEDGFIYIVARSKEIIKVRGKRVSPKEIEEVIVSVPSVVDCTIESFNNELLGEGIKALVVLKDGTDPEQEKENILSTCSSNLAPYKIPQRIEFIKNIKVSDSGKKVKN